MNLNNIESGNNIPNDINVIIEISNNESNIKYEIDNYGNLFVDRFINNIPMIYPCNYGFINKTLSYDNDFLDVLIPINESIIPKSIINCKPIGIIKMIDESGEDNKIIALPNFKNYKLNNINNIKDLPNNILNKLIYFFKNYKNLEENKWSKIISYEDKDSAKKEILNSINRYLNKYK